MPELRTVLDLPKDSFKPLDRDGVETLARITYASVQHGLDEAVEFSTDMKLPYPLDQQMPFNLAVLVKRLQWAGGQYSPAAIMYVAMSCWNPAQSVMWAYALWRRWRDTGNSVTMSDLIENTHAGDGLPPTGFLMELWDEQKDASCPLSNRLDDPATWDKTTGDVMKEAAVD